MSKKARKLYDPQRPSVAGLREIMETEGLLQREVAEITGTTDAGVRKWLQKADRDDHEEPTRPVPPLGAWKLLLLETGRHPSKVLVERDVIRKVFGEGG